MTHDEIMAALAAPDFEVRLRGRIRAVLDMVQTANIEMPYLEFQVDQVPVRLTPGPNVVTVEIGGTGDHAVYGWQIPRGWLTSTVTTEAAS